MKRISLIVFFFGLLSHGQNKDAPILASDPMTMFATTDNEVKSKFSHAQLLFIGTFVEQASDRGCSRLGWQFVYQDAQNEQGIRKFFRLREQANGGCQYTSDSSLSVSKSDYPIVGFSKIENKVKKLGISFDSAKATAEKIVGNGFYPQEISLETPMHFVSRGRVFWIFSGPVNCNKGASISIDAQTGAIENQFSEIPTCP